MKSVTQFLMLLLASSVTCAEAGERFASPPFSTEPVARRYDLDRWQKAPGWYRLKSGAIIQIDEGCSAWQVQITSPLVRCPMIEVKEGKLYAYWEGKTFWRKSWAVADQAATIGVAPHCVRDFFGNPWTVWSPTVVPTLVERCSGQWIELIPDVAPKPPEPTPAQQQNSRPPAYLDGTIEPIPESNPSGPLLVPDASLRSTTTLTS